MLKQNATVFLRTFRTIVFLVTAALLTGSLSFTAEAQQTHPELPDIKKQGVEPGVSDARSVQTMHQDNRSVQTHQTPVAHMTPRSTGSNELSGFYVRDVFVDSQGRLFVNTNHSSIDIYDGTSWQHLDVGEDIPAGVNNMTQGPDGTFWFATSAGINALDSNFMPVDSVGAGAYADYDTLSIQTSHVAVDDSGRVWTAHAPKYKFVMENGRFVRKLQSIGGISVYLPSMDSVSYNQEYVSSLDPNFETLPISDLLVRDNGNVWVSVVSHDTAKGGIAVLTPKRDTAWSYQSGSSGLPSNNVISLTEDSQGRVWTCFFQNPSDSTVGVARYDNGSWTSYTGQDAPFNGNCRTIETGGNNPVYAATSDTTVKFANGSWSSVVSGVSGQPLNGIKSIAFGFNGQTVFGQMNRGDKDWSGGFFTYDGSAWQFMSSANDGGLFGNDIFGVSVGNNGNVWAVGFYGAAMYDGSTWTYYSERDGLAHTYAWKVHVASDGTVWFGTTRNGVTYLQNGQFKIYNKYPETFFGEGIFEDSQGNIWFGSYYDKHPGILRYDGSGFTRYDTTRGVIGPIVHSFAEDANGDIIAASNRYGLARFDTATGQWSNWNPHPNRTLGDYSQHIGSDAQGNVWIPGGDSLFKWDGSQLHSIGLPDNMKQVTAQNLKVSPEGQVWMAGGPSVKVYADSAWHEPLSEAYVYGMAHGSDGRTYLGTYQNGLYVYNRSRAVATPDTRQQPEQISLGKNYPNPFNPTTRIKYSLPQASDVTLTVYDVIGRKVRTLVDSKQSAGSHRVTFDAGNLSSGVYIYRLQTDGFSKTRKMMLVK